MLKKSQSYKKSRLIKIIRFTAESKVFCSLILLITLEKKECRPSFITTNLEINFQLKIKKKC